jgi:hypothetical protein
MSKFIKKLQQNFANGVKKQAIFDDYKNSGDFSGDDLIKIYQNNYNSSLKNALGATYSCIKRLVGDEFFNYLSQEYIKSNNSKSGNIVDYGDNFADFIDNFEQLTQMKYLVDIAKLEFYYERCYHSKNAEFSLKSKFPIIDIWQMDENTTNVDLESGGDFVKIYKKNHQIVVEKLKNHQK